MTPRRTVPWNGDQRRPWATGTRVITSAWLDCSTRLSSGGISTHVSIMATGWLGGDVRPTCKCENHN